MASILPVELNRTIAARFLYAPAGPEERPMTPSIPVDAGVASNSNRNVPPTTWGRAEFTQVCDDATQPEEVKVSVTLQMVWFPSVATAARLLSDEIPACSDRNANFVPITTGAPLTTTVAL